MRYHVSIGGSTHEVDVSAGGVTVDGRLVTAELRPRSGVGVRSLLLDGVSRRLLARRVDAGVWELRIGGRALRAEVMDERTRRVRAMTGAEARASGPRPLKAPMPGLVIKVEVAPGDEVTPGQGLLIVEAMKMENELKAEVRAVVKHIHVQPGQTIDKDQVLIDFESVEPMGAV